MLLIQTSVRSSTIEGLGVFAEEPIARGTIIWEFTPDFDVAITPAKLKESSPLIKDFVDRYAYFSKRRGLYILSLDGARFMNHSNNPNIGEGPITASGETSDIALRDIQVGEELTARYDLFDDSHAFTNLQRLNQESSERT